MSLNSVLISNAYTSPNSGSYNILVSSPGSTLDTTGATSLGGGLAIYAQQVGDQLQFRSVSAGSTKLSASVVSDTVVFDVNEANLTIANMVGGTDIVYTTLGQTLSNKTLDSTNTVYDILKFDNTAHTFKYSLSGGNITANRNIEFGVLAQDDVLLYQNQAQGNITGPKTFTSGSFRVNDVSGAKYNALTASTNTVNVNVNIPALAISDDFVFNNNTTSLTNKRVSDSLSIGTTLAPNADSVLDLVSSTKAFIWPRLTTINKLNIGTPIAGMVVYDSDINIFQGYNGTAWDVFHKPRFGCYYISTPIETTIVAVATYYKVAGTSTQTNVSEDVSMSADNRLLYTGVETRLFKIDVSITATIATGNKTLEFIVFKNGSTPISSTTQSVFLSTNKDNNTSLNAIITAVPNDYFEIWVQNTDDSTNCTANNMTISLFSVD